MLDIHENNGQLALKAAGLFDKFLEIIHAGGQATRVLNKEGDVLFEDPDDGTGGRPEVPRGELRRILLESLPVDVVLWGHKLTAISTLGGGRHRLTFANGSTATTDLLVGADGTWSKVRPLLSKAKPVYAGITYVETYLYDSATRHKASAEAVGSGAMFALAPGKGIAAHREPNGVLHTYAALKKTEDWIGDIDFSNPADAVGCVAEEFDGWAPELVALLTDGETGPVPRPIYALPVEHRWTRVRGVTLLGDAAHLMAPSGEGANLAMYDGAELAKAIAASAEDVEAALLAYETDLFPRSASEAAEADRMQEVLFGDNSPQSLLDFFSDHQPVK
jgi:2-polyprenyl-6-methoxyphenol hydroxylase-like FAD-dependent oxidoreductase